MKKIELSDVTVSPIQLTFLTFGTIVGVGFITLPRGIIEKAREDAWITVLLALIISFFSLWLILLVARRFPKETVYQYAPRLLGKPLGLLFNLLFALHFLFMVVTGVRMMAEVVKTQMLMFTPIGLIILSMLATVLYSTWHGFTPIIRINESGQPLSLIMIVILLLFAYFRAADWLELRMPFWNGVKPVIEPLPSTVYSFIGFEILFFLYPFLIRHRKAYISAAAGIGLSGLFYLVIVLGTLVTLGPDVSMSQTFPVVTMVKTIEIVRQFVERAELLMIILWLPLAYTTHMVNFYFASYTFHHLLPRIPLRWWMGLLIPVVYLLAMVPDNMLEVEQWAKWQQYTGLFYLLGYPLLLLAAMGIRRLLGNRRP